MIEKINFKVMITLSEQIVFVAYNKASLEMHWNKQKILTIFHIYNNLSDTASIRLRKLILKL